MANTYTDFSPHVPHNDGNENGIFHPISQRGFIYVKVLPETASESKIRWRNIILSTILITVIGIVINIIASAIKKRVSKMQLL